MEYTKLKNINEYKSESINPMKEPDTLFEMYSVPIYETGHPEYLRGSDIGSNKVLVQKNDILLCKINPRINRVWIVADESEHPNIASSEWIVIRSKTYNPEFLAWYFRSPRFKKLMISEVTGIGGSLTRAQPKAVAEYPIPILPREDQEYIVQILNTIHHSILLKQFELQQLDELIKARFVEMFGCDRDFIMKAKHRVADICEARVGIVIQPTQYYTDDAENGVKAFRSLNVKPFYVNDADWVFFSKDSNNMLARTRVHTNDVAVVRSGANLGDSCIIPAEYDGCNAIDILLLTCNSEVLPLYLAAFINYPVGKSQILNVQRGGAIKHLNLKQLEQSIIFVPSMDEQNEFAAFVAQVDKSKFAVQKSLDETQLLFDNLMQQYFG